MIKFPPRYIKFFKKLVSLPDNIVFRVIGSFNMVQELLFYRISLRPALKFFFNTILVSNDMMTLRNIPSLFKKRRNDLGTDKEIFETERGMI